MNRPLLIKVVVIVQKMEETSRVFLFLFLQRSGFLQMETSCADIVLTRSIWEKNPWYMLASGDCWETTTFGRDYEEAVGQ